MGSPLTPVRVPWRRRPSSCVGIRFTPPSPHSWRAGSGRLPLGLSPILSPPKTSSASCAGATKRLAARENVFNHDLAIALVQIARQWVKVDAEALAELTRLAGKVPMPLSGLTDKNKRALGQFDDPAVLGAYIGFRVVSGPK